jgi:hypothetical protein
MKSLSSQGTDFQDLTKRRHGHLPGANLWQPYGDDDPHAALQVEAEILPYVDAASEKSLSENARSRRP